MTRAEFDEAIKVTCPACARGMPLKQRSDNKEWVHESMVKVNETTSQFNQTYCYASGLRNSRFAKDAE